MKEKDNIFVFLDGDANMGGKLFNHPSHIITTHDPNLIETCLSEIQAVLDSGKYLAGFFSYECGYALEQSLYEKMPEERHTPLLWFGVFNEPKTISFNDIDRWLHDKEKGSHSVTSITPSLDHQTYESKFNSVKSYISAGDIYQANFTFKGTFNFSGCPFSFYRKLRHGQQTALGGLIETGAETFISLSPELFFTNEKGIFSCRPMKGTAKRGVTHREDNKIKNWLAKDEKSQAENLMIVDLMRNDMSRISQPGSVKVENLYKIETYPSLHQMTSNITSVLKKDVSISEIIRNIFPCGSVTGAPKIRAMEIIRELEDSPRGIYTGAIGCFAPDNSAKFNVAIRTLRLKAGKGEIGIGSGLVSDSQAGEEYDECLLKMKFLENPLPNFNLLETMKWEKTEGYMLLDFHLDRLEKSAHYFSYQFDGNKTRKILIEYACGFNDDPQRVRLLLNKNGEVSLSHTQLNETLNTAPWTYVVSKNPVQSTDPFFYHKTTHRSFYDDERELQKAETGCDEVIFLNEKGEITEGSFTNIFLRINGKLTTPERNCGLLDGTYRRYLIERNEDPAFEEVLTLDDIARAEEIYLGNSVRGLIPARHINDKAKI